MNPGHNLALLARAPEPARSKTRLIPRLGAQGACDFAEAALLDTLHLMSKVTSCRRILFYTPQDADDRLRNLLKEENLSDIWELEPQPNTTDLGGRLQAALEYMQSDMLAHEVTDHRVIDGKATATFIGMDCLCLTPTLVELSMHTVGQSVGKAHMIPADDGGYVLLTVPLACDGGSVFSQIAWSTGRTGEMQVQSLQRADLTCEVADPLWDVDEPEDLDRLWETRESWDTHSSRTRQYLESVMSQ